MRRVIAVVALVLAGPVGVACAPAPAPVVACLEYSVECAVQEAFGPWGQAVVDEAMSVAWCESRLDPGVRNGQYLGLFQLGAYHYFRFDGDWADPYVNARAAEGLWKDSGQSWHPWECQPQ